MTNIKNINENLSIDKKNTIMWKKFINCIMIDGKKSKALKIFTTSLHLLKKKLQNTNPNSPILDLVHQALDNVKPFLEIRRVRVAGITYQVPAVIPEKRQQIIAIRWILESARKRKKNSQKDFSECLALELQDAFNKQGQTKQKRDTLHKTAEANRAYVRYRWW